jgi:hypothetical protein
LTDRRRHKTEGNQHSEDNHTEEKLLIEAFQAEDAIEACLDFLAIKKWRLIL